MSHTSSSPQSKPFLSNRVYDMLVWCTKYFLPAAGTLYFTLGGIWGFPNTEQVLGTLVATELFLGAILGLSQRSYNHSDEKYDGSLVIRSVDENKDLYTFDTNAPIEDLGNKDQILLKVYKQDT